MEGGDFFDTDGGFVFEVLGTDGYCEYIHQSHSSANLTVRPFFTDGVEGFLSMDTDVEEGLDTYLSELVLANRVSSVTRVL